MNMRLFVVVMLFAFAKANSQNISGTWQLLDDRTGKRSVQVTIYEEQGTFTGKISAVNDKKLLAQPLCIHCSGNDKNKPLVGLTVLEGIEMKGAAYKGGTFLNTENGKKYDCKMFLNDDNPDLLIVRVYISTIYKTQTWQRL